MNLIKTIAIPAASLVLASCGSNFEWFPKVEDTSPPAITASVSGKKLFANQTTHFQPNTSSTVTFAANEAATVYYTTSGIEPTTASANIEITSLSGVTGPTITLTDTILKFFGVDKSTKKNQSSTQTNYFKAP